MTKKVRIENADTSPAKVVVEVWDKGAVITDPSGTPLRDAAGNVKRKPDMLAFSRTLDTPTAMTGDDIFVTSTRYLVVKEA